MIGSYWEMTVQCRSQDLSHAIATAKAKLRDQMFGDLYDRMNQLEFAIIEHKAGLAKELVGVMRREITGH